MYKPHEKYLPSINCTLVGMRKLSIQLYSIKVITLLFITVLSACGGGSDTPTAPVTQPANVAPSADAGKDQSVNEKTTVTLSGSGSDSDGSIVSYSWAQTTGDSVTLTSTDSAITNFDSPISSTELILTFQLTVTDNQGLTAKDSVTIKIAPITLISSVIFSDANFSNCLSDVSETNSWEFTYQVSDLDCAFSNIITLDGIENLTALTTLYLTSNRIADISSLSNLKALTTLSLWDNQIEDISALSNLSALTYLDLDENQIANITALSNLTALESLWLAENQITNIAALSYLTALLSLDLKGNNNISCISLDDLTLVLQNTDITRPDSCT